MCATVRTELGLDEEYDGLREDAVVGHGLVVANGGLRRPEMGSSDEHAIRCAVDQQDEVDIPAARTIGLTFARHTPSIVRTLPGFGTLTRRMMALKAGSPVGRWRSWSR